jgi:hypothetical protein
MATMFSMIDLMNAALITQGFSDAVAENDGSDEWRLLSRNWAGIVEAELEDGLYSFSKEQAELLTRSDGRFGYDDAYLVPGDAIHVRRLWTEDADGQRDTTVDWVQDGTKVYVNAIDGVGIEYVTVADPSLWSANFARGVQMKLEACLLRCREAYQEAAAMDADAMRYFDRARKNSSRSRSAQPAYRPGRIAVARFSRG